MQNTAYHTRTFTPATITKTTTYPAPAYKSDVAKKTMLFIAILACVVSAVIL